MNISDTPLNAPQTAPQADLSAAEVQFQDVGNTEIAYRKVGSGEPLLLLHGFPLSGMTFRKIIPELAKHFTCYVVDLPGAGETRWTDRTDFRFNAQAESIKAFVNNLGLKSYAIIAHDTGATIARRLAIMDRARVTKLVAIGTEIPNHRPPYIQMFQKLSYVPGYLMMSRMNFKSRKFLRSSRAFGGVFYDLNLIEGEFHRLFIEPLIHSRRRLLGQRHFLRGIDWAVVDSLASGHRQIEAPVLLIWGEDDPIFPVELARQMIPQFKDCRGIEVIPKAKTFVHEEHPETVVRAALAFLRS
jgi:pimeloyl-ACP methyl ester carboxylesterase